MNTRARARSYIIIILYFYTCVGHAPLVYIILYTQCLVVGSRRRAHPARKTIGFRERARPSDMCSRIIICNDNDDIVIIIRRRNRAHACVCTCTRNNGILTCGGWVGGWVSWLRGARQDGSCSETEKDRRRRVRLCSLQDASFR